MSPYVGKGCVARFDIDQGPAGLEHAGSAAQDVEFPTLDVDLDDIDANVVLQFVVEREKRHVSGRVDLDLGHAAIVA